MRRLEMDHWEVFVPLEQFALRAPHSPRLVNRGFIAQILVPLIRVAQGSTVFR